MGYHVIQHSASVCVDQNWDTGIAALIQKKKKKKQDYPDPFEQKALQILQLHHLAKPASFSIDSHSTGVKVQVFLWCHHCVVIMSFSCCD